MACAAWQICMHAPRAREAQRISSTHMRAWQALTCAGALVGSGANAVERMPIARRPFLMASRVLT